MIRLTVSPGRQVAEGEGAARGMKADMDLVPPIDCCIRTKWKGAEVSWNDTEPWL